jgi:hypothetical protein
MGNAMHDMISVRNFPIVSIVDELRFTAELVAAEEDEFTPDYVVNGIYFGQGNPEQGGQHWNFTRSLNDDDGVCIVKEIQDVTVYGGIVHFTLSRHNLVCEFNEKTACATRTRRLLIAFAVDDEVWKALMKQAMRIFDGEAYFKLVS